MTIVKIQRPLFSNIRNKDRVTFFAYAKGHQHARFVMQDEMPPHVKNSMCSSYKEYFEADLVDGVWKFGNRVKQQEW
jgi:hypothetical protein